MAEHDDGPVRVTDENFGDLLVRGMEEALDVARGAKAPARRVRRTRTARDTEVLPPRRYRSAGVQEIRERLGLSQSVFARVLNASAETVKAWEQGKRQPDGIALTLLEIADDHPEVLMKRVRDRGGKPSEAASDARRGG